MTRFILKTTTAIALGVSLTAPAPILAANAEPGAYQVAQASNSGKRDKAEGNGAKAENAEPCADGTEPPCGDAASAEAARCPAPRARARPRPWPVPSHRRAPRRGGPP